MEDGLASLFFFASAQAEMCKEALLFFLILYTFLGPKSDHCLALVTQSLHPIVGFCFGFIKIDTWISLSCYMDLSELIHEFVKVVSWIFQSYSFFTYPLPNKTKLKFD